VLSVSCASAGNCSAGGYYADNSANTQAFVVSQVSGIWGTAKKVPGTATLNTGGDAWLTSVSCASAGNCSAGGYYSDSSYHRYAFVVSQVSGTWHSAKQVPGTATLNTGGWAAINSVACASAGNCSAGGYYTDSSSHQQAFVVSQVSGSWHSAKQVPGTATLNTSGNAAITSVACTSAGNCSAGGYYASAYDTTTGRYTYQAFVLSQASGSWHSAKQVPGTATLNAGGDAKITSVSCASAGNCSAGGYYASAYNSTTGTFTFQAFLLDQSNGTWGTAAEVPGTATLNTGGNAQVTSVSCAPAASCSAGGYYQDNSGQQAFVVSQT
jgi:hypothetical protein